MNLINFIRGDEVTGLRTRMIEVPVGSGNYKVWRLGDPIHSTPTIVGAPKARYDLNYGDSTYNAFYQQYRNRRQVVYVGANDGMLHAFNGGYYHKGDDSTTAGVTEHGWYTKNPTDNSSGPNLGSELWSFIPQELLPHLQPEPLSREKKSAFVDYGAKIPEEHSLLLDCTTELYVCEVRNVLFDGLAKHLATEPCCVNSSIAG